MVAEILTDTLYMLALLNPVSKIAVLGVAGDEAPGALRPVATKATLIAAMILMLTMIGGDFIFRRVFQIQLEALQIAGGLVLAWFGFGALRQGVFFERNTPARFSDLAIVPLACPMIAGPATITASLTLALAKPIPYAIVAMLMALGLNLLAMLAAPRITGLLTRFNILGALIRITGLIVMTMGVQMILNGFAIWRIPH